jgi:hypothetical protein
MRGLLEIIPFSFSTTGLPRFSCRPAPRYEGSYGSGRVQHNSSVQRLFSQAVLPANRHGMDCEGYESSSRGSRKFRISGTLRVTQALGVFGICRPATDL